ncbi:hypothetical protein HaLaN_11990, partial [Haematococcus lacustris]
MCCDPRRDRLTQAPLNTHKTGAVRRCFTSSVNSAEISGRTRLPAAPFTSHTYISPLRGNTTQPDHLLNITGFHVNSMSIPALN